MKCDAIMTSALGDPVYRCELEAGHKEEYHYDENCGHPVQWADDAERASYARISRTEMFFEVAHTLRKRSTCKRGKVGAVLVRDKHIVAQGYNGSPPGMPHCFELGCDVDTNVHDAGCTRTIHAEANLIAYAARYGTPTKDTVLYCTHGPCKNCAQLILASGIMAVHYQTPYRLVDGLELLQQAADDPFNPFIGATHHE